MTIRSAFNHFWLLFQLYSVVLVFTACETSVMFFSEKFSIDYHENANILTFQMDCGEWWHPKKHAQKSRWKQKKNWRATRTKKNTMTKQLDFCIYLQKNKQTNTFSFGKAQNGRWIWCCARLCNSVFAFIHNSICFGILLVESPKVHLSIKGTTTKQYEKKRKDKKEQMVGLHSIACSSHKNHHYMFFYFYR